MTNKPIKENEGGSLENEMEKSTGAGIQSIIDRIEKSNIQKIAVVLEPWGILLAVLGLIFSFYALALDRADRKQDLDLAEDDRVRGRIVDAWQILSIKGPGKTGKIAALEYLHNQRIDLTHIDLSSSPPLVRFWIVSN